jgi:hypothetical protein
MSVIIRNRFGYGRKLLAGILLIAAAVCILLAQLKVEIPFLQDLAVLTKLSGWEMAAVVICVLLFISGIAELEPWQMTFPAGIVYCIIDEPLGLPIVEFWPMMLIALILTIGLTMVIPEYDFVTYDHGRRKNTREAEREIKEAAKEAKEAAKEVKEAVKEGHFEDVEFREVKTNESDDSSSNE